MAEIIDMFIQRISKKRAGVVGFYRPENPENHSLFICLSEGEVDVFGAASAVDIASIGITETGETEELVTVPLIEVDWTGGGGRVVLHRQKNKSTEVAIRTATTPPITGKTFRRAGC